MTDNAPDHSAPLKRTVLLSLSLFKQTFGAKYRKSFLGYLWVLIPALLITAGVWLANRSGVIDAGVTTLPYALFVLVGVLLWQVFAESVEVPYKALEGARSYLTRVLFPREAILLVQAYEAIINTLIRFLFVALLALIFSDSPALGIAWLFACFAMAFILAVGIGLFLGPFLILFADLQNSLRLVLTYGIFLTPAFYSPTGGVFGNLVQYNPIAPIMAAAREALASGSPGLDSSLSIVFAVAVVLCALGVAFIKLAIPHLIERMLLGGR